jgi:hypothetical protein
MIDNPEEMNAMFEQTQMAGQVGQQAQASAAAQYYVQEQEKNLSEAQLDCEKTLNEIYHLLRQDVLRPVLDETGQETGRTQWLPLPDTGQRCLTEVGVDRIMQVMKSYVNKETLLSNFDEKMIKTRMLEFALALNANMFMKYEIYFRQPIFSECRKILEQRQQEQVKLRKFAVEMAGGISDEEEIKKEVLKSIENRIEYEIDKIKAEKRRQNLREYELLFVQMKAIVEAIHNRAWRGEERASLRRHTNISEVIGGSKPPQQAQQGGMFRWMKG